MPEIPAETLKAIFKKFCIVVLFSIAFAYIEAAVVVYLRAIFYPDGFTFPLTGFAQGQLWKRLLLTEIGREAATIVLILTSSILFAKSRRQRFAFFLTIFAIWDIFYYVWLKVLVDWPASLMDWDILFLIPLTWASPVLAPVLISLTMLVFAAVILYQSVQTTKINIPVLYWLGFAVAGFVIVLSFCLAGLHIENPDYRNHFSWPLFLIGQIFAILLFFKCALKPKTYES